MLSTKINTNIDYNYNSYLSDCDLINKYNLKNIYQKPKLETIVMDFSIENDTNSLSGNSIKAALVLYFISMLYPFVNIKKAKTNDMNKTKNTNIKYKFKIIFSNKNEINSILSTIFIENWNTLLLEDFILFNSKFNKTKAIFKKEVFKTKIPLQSFFELESFFSKVVTEINPKDLSVNLNFLFSNFIIGQNRKNLIQNLPNFWISG